MVKTTPRRSRRVLCNTDIESHPPRALTVHTGGCRQALRGVPKPGVRLPCDLSSGTGMRRGNAVDAEICAYVNRGVQPMLGYTRKVLKALDIAKLRPERAQVEVYDASHGLGTGVDLLCSRADRHGKRVPVVVELKMGWNTAGAYDAACGRMSGVLAGLGRMGLGRMHPPLNPKP